LLLVTISFLGLTLLSLPAVAALAFGSLEWRYPPMRQRPADAQAIVVLGGSVRPPDSQRTRPELGRSSFDRCQHALEVYRQGAPCPLLASGGNVDPTVSTTALGLLMRDFLSSQGVPPDDILVEDRSRTTYENAVESAKLLASRGMRKVVLVTEAAHMPRAVACFRRQGIDVIPAACNYRSSQFDWSLFDFLPSPQAALDWDGVLHEWLGLIWYRFHDRI
jgi:uncharacterized SAM-binding protein YcdF (DUF218 family)